MPSNTRPLLIWLALLMTVPLIHAQDPPAVMRARSNNKKLQAQAQRLHTQERVETEQLRPYEGPKTPLRRRVRKGYHHQHPSNREAVYQLYQDPHMPYLQLLTGPRSTHEPDTTRQE